MMARSGRMAPWIDSARTAMIDMRAPFTDAGRIGYKISDGAPCTSDDDARAPIVLEYYHADRPVLSSYRKARRPTGTSLQHAASPRRADCHGLLVPRAVGG